MSKRLLLLFFMVWVALFLPLTAQEKEGGDLELPLMQFQSTEFDFGEIEQQLQLPFQFTLTNNGLGLLKITGIQPTCGCTLVENQPSEVAPGASTTIKGTFNSSSYSGEIVRIIKIFTNDPQNAEAQLFIKAKVVETLSLEPRTITIANIKAQKEKVVKEIILHHTKNIPFNIVRVDNSSAYYKITYSEKAGPKQVIKVEIDPVNIPEPTDKNYVQRDDIKIQVMIKGENTPSEKIVTVYLY